ncbi:hypothetical protein [Pseudooceanicola sp. MF1-13]|uniref:hypothetical protein n=1 Tax=Pseudooceanicola sp. MF1-13 TaxID=3379095 RepID=UPI00389280A4
MTHVDVSVRADAGAGLVQVANGAVVGAGPRLWAGDHAVANMNTRRAGRNGERAYPIPWPAPRITGTAKEGPFR